MSLDHDHGVIDFEIDDQPVYDPFELLKIQFPDQQYTLNDQWVEDKASSLGLFVVRPDAFTLLLDFDSPEQWSKFLGDLLPTFIQFEEVERVHWTESANGNKHVYIRMKNALGIVERIAFQAALGSDPKRELLGLIGERNGKENATVLFEKEEAAEVVIFAMDGYQPLLTDGSDNSDLVAWTGKRPKEDLSLTLDDTIPY